jgi:iron complex outermembrane receptor protein
MKKVTLLMALILFCSWQFVLAQKTITGKVIDASDGTSIPGVSVVVKGTTTGTLTDLDGIYSVKVPADAQSLEFSFLGYETKEVAIGNLTTIDVSLSVTAEQLEGVVVTALGIRKDIKRIGYSVQKVASKDLSKAAAPNIAQGLMGKAAGVNVSQPNGIEGGSQRIVIRGNTSLLGNNQPLIVIDGIQMADGRMGLAQNNGSGYNIKTGRYETPDLAATQTDWGSNLNFINSADIEDINILKGPTAAALYGARGSNGVILITTKKGGQTEGFGLEYNFSTRWNQAYLFQDYQKEWGYGGSNGMWSATDRLPKDANGNLRYPMEAVWSGGGVGDQYTQFGPIPGGYMFWDQFSWPGCGLSWGAKMQGQPVVWWDGVTRPYSPTADVNKSFFRTGNTTDHNLSFSKAGDFGSVRVSINRTNNNAIIPNSGYDQTSFNIGSNLNLSKKTKVEAVAGYTRYNRENTPSMGDNNSIGKFLTYGFPADYINLEKDIYVNADGSKNLFDNNAYPMSYPYSSYTNLNWHTYKQNSTLQRDQLTGSVKLSADVTPWLNLMGRTGVDFSSNKFETKNTPIDAAGYQGQYGFEMNKDYTVTGEAMATAHKSNLFKDLDASLSVGTSTWYNKFEGTSAYNNGPFANPSLYYLSNTTATVNTGWLPTYYRLESKINSVYGLMDLSYKNYLFLQLTGRNDWSSTLPIDMCSYFYPSASLSFAFTEAFDMSSTKGWLDFGKIRLAYAGSAAGTDPYQTSTVFYSGVFGGAVSRYLPTTLPTKYLKPQRSASLELGTQLSFLKNRLSLDFSYYNIKSTDQILQAQVSVTSGVNTVTINTGELQNQGIEFIIRATAVKKGDFEWNLGLNAAHNQNKVIALGEGVDKYYLGQIFGTRTGVSMYAKAGENYGTIYGLDYTYLNGEKVVVPIYDKGDPTKVVGTRYVTTKDPVAIGNATPFLTGGLSNNFRYKRFSLYFLTDFKLGGDVYCMDYASAMGEGKAPETVVERNGGGLPFVYPDGTTANDGVILDGVFADGTKNTDVVSYMYKYAGQYQAWSNVDMPRSNAVFENTWIKCREVSLTYDLPIAITQKTKVFQGLSFSLIGRDLFYFYKTLPDNMNPEGVSGAGNLQGFQWAALPGTRSYGFSIKAKF